MVFFNSNSTLLFSKEEEIEVNKTTKINLYNSFDHLTNYIGKTKISYSFFSTPIYF